MIRLKLDKIILLKIVYFGPALCGKTTNLYKIFERLRPEQKPAEGITEVPTARDRTVSFEAAQIEGRCS